MTIKTRIEELKKEIFKNRRIIGIVRSPVQEKEVLRVIQEGLEEGYALAKAEMKTDDEFGISCNDCFREGKEQGKIIGRAEVLKDVLEIIDEIKKVLDLSKMNDGLTLTIDENGNIEKLKPIDIVVVEELKQKIKSLEKKE
jgi:hypothetical protein